MKTSSAKAKGRRLCQKIAEKFLEWAPDLHPDDVYVTPSGVTGEDLKLSPRAREIYPLAVECKAQEGLNIWAALEQSRTHVKAEGIYPVVCFTRNREGREYIAMEVDHFLKLMR